MYPSDKNPIMTGNEPANPAAKSWDRWLSAAYLRMTGASQRPAAKAVGVSERTLRRWEADKRWPTACAEARGRWLHGVEIEARAGLARGLQNDQDGHLSFKVLQRLDPDFAPPRERAQMDWRFEFLERVSAMPTSEIERLEKADDAEIVAFLEAGQTRQKGRFSTRC